MLNYKDYIIPNIGLFFRHKNTIDIFVEDNYDEEFYLALLNRVFSKTGHSIKKLLPLGCKRKVIDACVQDQVKRSTERIYIVDGDLELILDNNVKGLKHLFVLERYCIENYIFHEDSIIEIIHDYLVINKKKIKEKLDFDNWLKGLSKNLIELFLHYALCKEICPTIPTISLGVGNLCEQVAKIPVLNETKCNQRIIDIKSELLKVISEEEYNERIYRLRTQWPYTIETLLQIVSAKDYLIPLLEFRFYKFKSINSINMRRGTLRLRLAKLCDTKHIDKILTYT